MTAGVAARPTPQAAPLSRSFWTLCGAFFVANLATGIAAVAFPWLVTTETRDPILVAGVTMAAELPWLLMSLPAGAIIDRGDHRRMLSVSHLLRAVLIVGLAFIVLYGSVHIAVLYAIAFVVGTLTVANENVTQTLLPRLVPQNRLEMANGNLVVAETTAGVFIGPLVGGILVLASLSTPFFVEGSLFLVAALLVTFVVAAPRATAPSTATLRADIAVGLRYFWRHPVLRPLGLFLGLLNLASAIAIGTQVLFAQEILGLNSFQYGLLFSVGAIGAMAGAPLAQTMERRLGARRTLLVTLAGNGAVALTIGLTSSAVLVCLALAVGASLAVVWNVLTISYRQRIVPDEMLGRVNSIYRMLAWGPLPFGTMLGGVVVSVAAVVATREAGLRAPLFLSAAVTLTMFVIALFRLRSGIWSRNPEDYRADHDTALAAATGT
ncbi:MAG TPA: MFS transporter, partial [Pseudonocardiaceae bacterium]